MKWIFRKYGAHFNKCVKYVYQCNRFANIFNAWTSYRYIHRNPLCKLLEHTKDHVGNRSDQHCIPFQLISKSFVIGGLQNHEYTFYKSYVILDTASLVSCRIMLGFDTYIQGGLGRSRPRLEYQKKYCLYKTDFIQ